MFGLRPDGRKVKDLDPIIEFTPYIMPTRVDAQVFMQHDIDYAKLATYIAEKSREGIKVTFMEILIAGYVRSISQFPEVNRFIINKKMYCRKEITTSFVVLVRHEDSDEPEETTVKIKFDPSDTIFDVSKRMKEEIIKNRKPTEANGTLKFARILMNIPFLPSLVIGFLKFLDRYGLLIKPIINISPFHTGIFVTNNASIGLSNVYHHIYNFGSTGLFMAIGAVKKTLVKDKDGNVRKKRWLPIGITADERICAGAKYSQFFAEMRKYLDKPSLLETPPQKIVEDQGIKIQVAKPE